MIITVAVWVGSPGPALCFLGGGQKYVPDDSLRHMKQLLAYEQFIYTLPR